jgi:ketosteroid isomerase-like protein
MRKSVSSLLTAAIVAAGLGQALPSRAQSQDEQAIRALQGRLAAAMNAKDVDAIMKGYVPGSELFVFDLGLPRQHAGWDAYKKDWQDFFDALQGPPKVEIKDLSITTYEEVAFSHSIQQP